MSQKWIVKNNKKVVRWSDHSLIAKVESETDSHLIAAAPEVLEALKSIIEFWKNNDQKSYASDLATDAIEAIRHAELS